MNRLVVILGYVAVITYIIWYNYVFKHYPDIDQIYNDTANMIIYGVLGAAFFELGNKQKDLINKLFVYYAIGEFWIFLILVISYNMLIDNKVTYHKAISAILLVFAFNFFIGLLILIKWFRKS